MLSLPSVPPQILVKSLRSYKWTDSVYFVCTQRLLLKLFDHKIIEGAVINISEEEAGHKDETNRGNGESENPCEGSRLRSVWKLLKNDSHLADTVVKV